METKNIQFDELSRKHYIQIGKTRFDIEHSIRVLKSKQAIDVGMAIRNTLALDEKTKLHIEVIDDVISDVFNADIENNDKGLATKLIPREVRDEK